MPDLVIFSSFDYNGYKMVKKTRIILKIRKHALLARLICTNYEGKTYYNYESLIFLAQFYYEIVNNSIRSNII